VRSMRCRPIRPGRLLLLVGLAIGGVSLSTALAGEEPELSFVERLGVPARPSAVRDLVAEVLDQAPDECRRAASALSRAGGSAAADGLRRLLGHSEISVRISALDAAARLGIRLRGLTLQVRSCLESWNEGERCAALRALGVVGDGSDVPALLEALTLESAESRLAACEALRALGGPHLRPTPARWTHWWRAEQRTVAKVKASVEALLADPEASCNRESILRDGWTVLPMIEAALTEWFDQGTVSQKLLALRIVGRYRLADFADAVRWEHRAGSAELAPEARGAAAALGIHLDGEQDASRSSASPPE